MKFQFHSSILAHIETHLFINGQTLIINQNNGSIEKISYNLKGFKDPLVRNVKVSDDDSSKRFIENIEKNNDVKEDLKCEKDG